MTKAVESGGVCEVWRPGCLPYREAWALQQRLAVARGQDESPDRLLLLEHPPVFTTGSVGQSAHVLWTAQEMAARGIELVATNRGGDVTWHGPGQLVGYPILRLPRRAQAPRLDVHGYLRRLEYVLVRTLADYGVEAATRPGRTGVWVGDARGERKLAAIGVRVTARAVTLHGFALNVCNALDWYEGIVACGIQGHGVSNMVVETGAALMVEEVSARLAGHFGAVFGFEMLEGEGVLT
ncbi:MAG: lipoyl(octanoyl) transferase LipB [Anaerolineaceae bacterium]|nr:lipoyl(octanoyl) transferase LipB [Anaerolineaceae bacterium]MDE0329079.1 lipoyl(octanoyl) transferase LipB [Anaerolineaceae bacterium]